MYGRKKKAGKPYSMIAANNLEPEFATCPHCRARFEIKSSVALFENTKLRCGSCLQIFEHPRGINVSTEDVVGLDSVRNEKEPIFPRTKWYGLLFGILLSIILLGFQISFLVTQQGFHDTDSSLFVFGDTRIFEHPTIPSVLAVQLQIENQSQRNQSYPSIEIEFYNSVGDAIALGHFLPAQYIGADWLEKEIKGNGLVSVGFDVIDPGADSHSYVIAFR